MATRRKKRTPSISSRTRLYSRLAPVLSQHPRPRDQNLVAWLIATHHGKVRLSLRAFPGERPPDSDCLYARGVWQDDPLPGDPTKTLSIEEVPLDSSTPLKLDLTPMQMGDASDGTPSWTTRMLALRDAPTLGIFRLAWLETLLRAADAEGSRLVTNTNQTTVSPHDLAAKSSTMENPSAGAESSCFLERDSGGRRAQHGIRTGAGQPQNASGAPRPDRATRYIETTQGILSNAQLAPLVAREIETVEAAIYKGDYDNIPFDETLLLDIHRKIAAPFVPDWAGRWRDIPVTVGNWTPPPPHEVSVQMRNYFQDTKTRWEYFAGDLTDQTLEMLAFIEGRFLSIHPFQDFNGRVIRLFLRIVLRRLDFPRLDLEPESDYLRQTYFRALEAADKSDWTPLMKIWESRITQS